jgi:hypothetical protein
MEQCTRLLARRTRSILDICSHIVPDLRTPASNMLNTFEIEPDIL